MPKDSHYTKAVDDIILHLRQGGIIQHLEASSIPARFRSEQTEDPSPVAFEIEHFLAGFTALGLGMTTALFRFIWEVVSACGRNI